jgi:hypothetical protein
LVSALPSGWKGYQNTSSAAKKGTAIAVRTDVFDSGDFSLTLGVEPNGQKMETRWIAKLPVTVIETGERRDLISGHEPPQRYAELQPTFTNNLKQLVSNSTNPVVGVDANMPIETLANKVNLKHAYGEGIIGVLTNANSLETDVVNMEYSDHPAIKILLDS